MFILTLQLILCFSGRSNQSDEILKQLSCLHFYIFELVFNFQLLFFTVNNVTLQHMAMQQTGTLLVMTNFTT